MSALIFEKKFRWKPQSFSFRETKGQFTSRNIGSFPMKLIARKASSLHSPSSLRKRGFAPSTLYCDMHHSPALILLLRPLKSIESSNPKVAAIYHVPHLLPCPSPADNRNGKEGRFA